MTGEELMKASLDGKSVIGFHAHREIPLPAAFILGMQFRIVHQVLPRLKIYTPTSRRKHPIAGRGI